jgi:hypothetical protein
MLRPSASTRSHDRAKQVPLGGSSPSAGAGTGAAAGADASTDVVEPVLADDTGFYDIPQVIAWFFADWIPHLFAKYTEGLRRRIRVFRQNYHEAFDDTNMPDAFPPKTIRRNWWEGCCAVYGPRLVVALLLFVPMWFLVRWYFATPLDVYGTPLSTKPLELPVKLPVWMEQAKTVALMRCRPFLPTELTLGTMAGLRFENLAATMCNILQQNQLDFLVGSHLGAEYGWCMAAIRLTRDTAGRSLVGGPICQWIANPSIGNHGYLSEMKPLNETSPFCKGAMCEVQRGTEITLEFRSLNETVSRRLVGRDAFAAQGALSQLGGESICDAVDLLLRSRKDTAEPASHKCFKLVRPE